MKPVEKEAYYRDEIDPFKPLTYLFNMPVDAEGRQAIYLNGNSLGPKPKSVDQALKEECNKWGCLGVRGHFESELPWVTYHECVSNSLARLVGAQPEEVVAMGTLTTNLHFTFVSFYHPTPKRFKIIRLSSFPSDSYAIASQIKQRWETIYKYSKVSPFNLQEAIIEIIPESNNHYIDLDTIANVIEEHGESTAIVWIEAVHYLTGQYFNISEVARLAHLKGCKIGLDLAHAIGNVPLKLHTWQVDFAVWCSYKYLSGGPGAIAGLYVHEKYHTDKNIIRFAGWWGNNKLTRFHMMDHFDPIPTTESWQLSNPDIFSLAALKQSLSIFDQVDLYLLREKNKRLVLFLEQLLVNELGNIIHIITPSNPDERGCQLSFEIVGANFDEIEKMFFQSGIIADTRKNVIRVAPMGLYTTFMDIFNFVTNLEQICQALKC